MSHFSGYPTSVTAKILLATPRGASPPDFIRAGRKNFPEDIIDDPAIAEKYHDAFESLCKRGYIRHDDGILFRLTYAGFEKARQLVAVK